MPGRGRTLRPTTRRAATLAATCAGAALIGTAGRVLARWDAVKLSPTEASAGLSDERMTVLDVRTERERAGGAIPGAIPTSWRRPQLPADDRDVLVVCSHGARSLRAAHTLRRQGVEARSLRGGMRAYVRGGGLVEPRP